MQKFVTDPERARMIYQNTSCMTSCAIRANAYFGWEGRGRTIENECGFGR